MSAVTRSRRVRLGRGRTAATASSFRSRRRAHLLSKSRAYLSSRRTSRHPPQLRPSAALSRRSRFPDAGRPRRSGPRSASHRAPRSRAVGNERRATLEMIGIFHIGNRRIAIAGSLGTRTGSSGTRRNSSRNGRSGSTFSGARARAARYSWCGCSQSISRPILPKPWIYFSPAAPQSTNWMPSLKVALLSAIISSSSMPARVR